MNVVWCLTQARKHLWDQYHKAQTQKSVSTTKEPGSIAEPYLPESEWQPYRNWYRSHPQLQQSPCLDVIMQWWLSHSASTSSQWFHPAWVGLGFGALFGGLAMVGLLSFAYPSPINVFYWLGMFIVLPWVLMLVVFIAKRWWSSKPKRWQPIAPTDPENDQRLSGFVGVSGNTESTHPIFWQKWLLSTWRHLPERLLPSTLFLINQCVALGYLLGGLFVFTALLLMQDLAFGWASTLALSSQAVEHFVSVISWPWHIWWPEAVPSEEIIAQTRFFRLSPQTTDVYHFGEWWPFLMATLLFYGLIPRSILWWWANQRFQRQVLRTCDQDQVLSTFYQFLVTPQLDTGSKEVALQNPDAELSEQFEDHLFDLSPSEFTSQLKNKEVVLWGNHDAKRRLDAYPQSVLTLLGADKSYGEDIKALESLLERTPKEVIWLASGWEPPTAELQDFSAMFPQYISQKVLLFSADQCPIDAGSWQHFVERHMPNARLSGQIAQEVL